MKLAAVAIFLFWLLAIGATIYGYGLQATIHGLDFGKNETAALAWLIVAGMPLLSIGLYLASRRYPDE